MDQDTQCGAFENNNHEIVWKSSFSLFVILNDLDFVVGLFFLAWNYSQLISFS